MKKLGPGKKLDPGSREAIIRGCRCDVRINNHGLGYRDGGQTYFFPDLDCPLHGIDAVSQKRAVKKAGTSRNKVERQFGR